MSQGLGPSYSPPEVLTQKMRGREKRGFLWGRRMGGRGWGLQIYRTIVHGRSPQFYGNNTERSGPVIPTEGKKKPLGSVNPPREVCVSRVRKHCHTCLEEKGCKRMGRTFSPEVNAGWEGSGSLLLKGGNGQFGCVLGRPPPFYLPLARSGEDRFPRYKQALEMR